MSRTRGEGRSEGEKQQTLLRTPEARREHREKLLREEAEWREKNGPVTVTLPAKTIHVDGACTLRERTGDGDYVGPGGWAWVWLTEHGSISDSGNEAQTTNQRMELKAAAEAMKAHRDVRALEIVSDSAYLVNCFLQQWYVGWERRDWRASSGRPVKNQDLWRQLLYEVQRREEAGFEPVKWTHVRGHAGDPGNEAADDLAVAAKLELMR